MKIKISDKEKVMQFAIIFSNLKTTFEEANLYFNTTGLYFQATDSSLISMVEFNITSEWFDIYEIKMYIKQGLQEKLLGGLFASVGQLRNKMASEQNQSGYL